MIRTLIGFAEASGEDLRICALADCALLYGEVIGDAARQRRPHRRYKIGQLPVSSLAATEINGS